MGEKILLIEEDSILRNNTAEILELANYAVFTAENGKVGVEMAIKLNPDVVISDISMPEIDGYGVLQILRKNKELQKTPFIFMSAKTEHTDVRKGMDLGASDYITIPFEESELLSAVETRLKIRKSFNSPIKRNFNSKDTEEIELESLYNIFANKNKYYYKKGAYIYCEGNNNNHLFYLVKGKVKAFQNNEYGKELITGIFKNKSLFGFTSLIENKPCTENTVALEDTTILKITKREFLKIVRKNPQLAVKIIHLLVDKLENLKTHLIHFAYDSVRKKTAETLYELYIEGGSEIIDISRNNLASLVGIAKETLIRTLTDLKEEKIIKTKRKTIKIINSRKLKKIK